MRSLILILGVVACGNDEGAVLTISAPDGPSGASRIEIVLASAATEAITNVDRQRVRPGVLAGEPVRYYRQRTTAGLIEGVSAVDGFALRIEPDATEAADPSFIPFLFVYDANDALVGAGAVLDAAGEPSAVAVERGRVASYVVTMTSLVATDLATGLAPGQTVAVACGANTGAWRSGVAWQPGGTQLRVLFADTSTDPAAVDATARDADLDCDHHAADKDDCDDLRAKYHPGAPPDLCDGEDTNCDGARLVVSECALEVPVCMGTPSGVQLCADTGGAGSRLGACVADPACQCVAGTCSKCVVSFVAADAVRTPCAPAIGKLHVGQLGCSIEAPCTVEVVPRGGAWDTKLALVVDGTFSSAVMGVIDQVFLRTKYVGPGQGTPAGTSVGAVYLAITAGGTAHYLGVDLELATDSVAECSQVDAGNGNFAMTCSP